LFKLGTYDQGMTAYGTYPTNTGMTQI